MVFFEKGKGKGKRGALKEKRGGNQPIRSYVGIAGYKSSAGRLGFSRPDFGKGGFVFLFLEHAAHFSLLSFFVGRGKGEGEKRE